MESESTPLLGAPLLGAPAQPEEDHRRSRLIVLLTASALVVLLGVLGGVRMYGEPTVDDRLVKTVPFRKTQHPMTPSTLWGNVKKPYPTGAFWTNLAVNNGTSPVGLLPYGVSCRETGVLVSYGATRRYTTQVSVWDDFLADLTLTANEIYTDRQVSAHDFASVTMDFSTATGGGFRAPLVKGAPFVTVEYTRSTPVIDASVNKFYNVEEKAMTDGSKGTLFLITLWNWQKWLVYCSETVSFTREGNRLTADTPITGFLRVAFVPSGINALPTLLRYVHKYPVSTSLSLAFPKGDSAVVTYTYATVGTGPLLMLSLAHHAELLKSPATDEETTRVREALTPLYCMKGRMHAVIGDIWKLHYLLPKVGFNFDALDKPSEEKLSAIKASLEEDIMTVPSSFNDPYQFGKEIGRMGRLAIIADEMDRPEQRAAAVLAMETALVPWLTGTNADELMYDEVYGGIIPRNGLADEYADYGSAYYSDHHFHYGYFMYAFAVLSKLDPAFADAHRSAFDSIVRDVCTIDPTDDAFPYVRHKDFFDGHSWASGLYNQQNGKGQESSSEAVNAYYAAYLYAKHSDKPDLSNVALLLLAMEVQAAKWYWQMRDDSSVYDSLFASRKMVGNVGALDATTTTWFGFELEFVHGINIMPVTPATALLLDRDFVQEQWPLLGSVLPTPEEAKKAEAKVVCSANKACQAIGLGGDCCPAPSGIYLGCCDPRSSGERPMQNDWKSLLYADLAIINRDIAWSKLLEMKGYGSGGSRSNYLFWAATRPPSSALIIETHSVNYTETISPFCDKNSNCDALGLTGLCCPAGNGVLLGCCPKVVDPFAKTDDAGTD